MNEPTVTIIGNIAGDPELRFTSSGVAVANFRILSTPRQFDRQSNEWKDGETLGLNCAAWKQLGENVAESLTKGTRVIAQGRLRARSYETKEGERRTSQELEVDEVGPSLKYATAKVNRNSRGGGQSRGAQSGGFGRTGFQGDSGGFGGQQSGGWDAAQPGAGQDDDCPF